MNSIKCKNCGLTNFPTDVECRRCGRPFKGPKAEGSAPRRFSIVTLVLFAALAVASYYIFTGMQKSVSEVNANEANRVASQPPQPDAGLSRTEQDRRRAQRVGNAVNISPGLTEHQNRTKETEKMVEQLANAGK